MKKQDLAVAAYLVAAFVMMIIPIPSWLLDILLACNIALGFTILFTAMFAKEVLDMSFFPTILLFTTIFRIALNISSTRLILTTGDQSCGRNIQGDPEYFFHKTDSDNGGSW